jgi:hypothetical protein
MLANIILINSVGNVACSSRLPQRTGPSTLPVLCTPAGSRAAADPARSTSLQAVRLPQHQRHAGMGSIMILCEFLCSVLFFSIFFFSFLVLFVTVVVVLSIFSLLVTLFVIAFLAHPQDQYKYCCMLQAADDSLKKLVDALKSTGLWDNTLLVV